MADAPSNQSNAEVSIEEYRPATLGEYPQEAREAVFEVWAFMAQRNAERTVRILKEQPELLGNYPAPTGQAVRNWARKENWPDRVTARLAQAAPKIMAHSAAQMVQLQPEVLAVLSDLMRGETVGKDGFLRFQAASKLADLIGLQRISEMSIDAIARSVEEQVDAGDEEVLSPEELALKKSRENRERLMERRQRRTGKHRDSYERR